MPSRKHQIQWRRRWKRPRAGALWLTACLVLAALLGYRGLFGRADDAAPRYVTKNIEDVAAGDLVLATNPDTGVQEAKRVEEAFRRTSDHLRVLRFEGPGRQQELKTTNEHPFWVPAAGKFVPAGDLAVGDTVTGPGGELQRVVATEYEPHPEGVRVYNFRVADFHSYYVAARGTRAPPVLVHNANYPDSPGTRKVVNDDLLEQQGISEVAPPSGRGMQNPAVRDAVENGDIEHSLLQERMRQKGWRVDRQDTGVIDPATGTTVYPDAISPLGHPVEIKPPSPTGARQGAQQLQKYERATGRKGRVIHY